MSMDIFTATEESYKNGYLKGVEDTKKEYEAKERHGRWIVKKDSCFCSVCMVSGSPRWKRCPVCEAKMEIVLEEPDAKTIKIYKIPDEVKSYG